MMTGESERRLEMSRRVVFGDRGISVFLRCQKTARETVTRRRESRIGDALDESGDGVWRARQDSEPFATSESESRRFPQAWLA
jgi:hypothetical protein